VKKILIICLVLFNTIQFPRFSFAQEQKSLEDKHQTITKMLSTYLDEYVRWQAHLLKGQVYGTKVLISSRLELEQYGSRIIPGLLNELKSQAKVKKKNWRLLGQLFELLVMVAPDDREKAAEAFPVLKQIYENGGATYAMIGAMIKANPEKAIPLAIKYLPEIERGTKQRGIPAAPGLGLSGPAAVPYLLQLMKNPDPKIRASALLPLGYLGLSAIKALPDLIRALHDPDNKVRKYAALALEKIGPGAGEAIPVLEIRSEKDPSLDVRKGAARALASINARQVRLDKYDQKRLIKLEKESLDTLMQTVIMAGVSGSPPACVALGNRGPKAGKAVPCLIKSFRGSDPSARLAASIAIVKIGPGAIPALVDALNDPDGAASVYAAYTLGQMGLKAKQVLPALTQMAAHGRFKGQRRMAGYAIQKIKGEKTAVKRTEKNTQTDYGTGKTAALINNLKDHDFRVSGKAARDLVQIGKPAVPFLMKALNDPFISYAAVDILGRMGPGAKDAFDEINKAFPRLGAHASVALSRLDPVRALGVLKAYLHDSKTSSVTPEGFAAIGPDAVPVLKDALQNHDRNIRLYAMKSLGEIGPLAADALPQLILMVKDHDKEIQVAAIRTLRKMVPAARSAVPDLLAVVHDTSAPEKVRLEAAAAIRLMQGQAESSLEEWDVLYYLAVLYSARFQKNEALEKIAISALGNIGPQAKKAVPVLEKMIRDPKAAGSCFEALRKISGHPEKYVAPVMAATQNSSALVKAFAYLALGRAGARAKPAAKLIETACYTTGEVLLRQACLKALGDIGPGVHISEKKQLFEIANKYKQQYPQLLIWLRYALAATENDPVPHVAALLKMMSDKRCDTIRDEYYQPWSDTFITTSLSTRKKVVLSALRRLGPRAGAALLKLIEIVQTEADRQTVCLAVRAIGAIGPGAKQAAPALMKLFGKISSKTLQEALLDAIYEIEK